MCANPGRPPADGLSHAGRARAAPKWVVNSCDDRRPKAAAHRLAADRPGRHAVPQRRHPGHREGEYNKYAPAS